MQNSMAVSALLRTRLAEQFHKRPRKLFQSGFAAMDHLAPDGGLRCGAIHELLFDKTEAWPKSLALRLARAAQEQMGGVIVWSDPRREIYPAAVSTCGIDLRRLVLLRPRNAAQEISALTECLRCRGVSAVVTNLHRVSMLDARRLQLAAESGGGAGIFLRPLLKESAGNYAAATRWLVRPALQDAGVQSWHVELLHGHGGRLGLDVLLEVDRETGDVRESSAVADRPSAASAGRASA